MTEKRFEDSKEKQHCDKAAEPAVAYGIQLPDLQTLRHDIVDAVYRSQDKKVLYSCWELLTDSVDKTITAADADDWENRVLSKEEGEQLVRETLLPAYRDVLEAEKRGERFPDISELFKELDEDKKKMQWK